MPLHSPLPIARAVLWPLALMALSSVWSAPEDFAILDKGYEAEAPPLTAEESWQGMRLPEDLAMDLLVAEPAIQQPVFLNFDARGRMWVVEYRQYPEPAGVKIVSRDRFWRNVYDRKPQPPGHPNFVPGLDRISIHEDTNGDGSFDQSKIFVDGLNLATSCAIGDGGIWVLNPPYLLFFPDADGDDVPDAAPEVHLDGFGIQDSHSVVSSLGWGPDGWLYGAQGSTVTSDITVSGSDAPPISRIGQLMWRYHPTHKIYEVFAEGGGNVWSAEFDSAGRLLAGTNDKFPAYFFLQGAFYKKNFGKHGALSNPHAYDFFNGIDAPGHRRISNSVLVYEGAALPARYDRSLIFLGALQGIVGSYQLELHDLNYRGTDLDFLVDAQDRWFRPVYMESGPDGAIYVCDWYDQQINHFLNHEGQISKSDGRLFRIRAPDAKPQTPFDLTQRSTDELVDLLDHPNRWWRETAQTLLSWRPDRASVAPRLRQLLELENGQSALEALWALHRIGSFDDSVFTTAITHPHPTVRQWAVRLVGDQRNASNLALGQLTAIAETETNLEVIGQFASSVARLPLHRSLRIFASLLRNPHAQGVHPIDRLLWWGLEPYYTEHSEVLLGFFGAAVGSDRINVSPDLARFFTRRVAASGHMVDLEHCATLIEKAQNTTLRDAMIAGFEDAYRGRSMTGLPPRLVTALVDRADAPLSLRLRLDPEAHFDEALALLRAPETDALIVQRLLEVITEQPVEAAFEVIILRTDDTNAAVQLAALAALQSYSQPRVAHALVPRLAKWSGQLQSAAQSLLSSRAAWSRIWLDSIASGRTSADLISATTIEAMRSLQDPALTAEIEKQFGEAYAITPTVYSEELARIQTVLKTVGGDPRAGHALYQQRCAACHTLFADGGQLGPDLTSYQRDQTTALLLSIINPSAEIRSGYEMVTLRTKDGRTLSGFLARDENDIVSLRVIGGGEINLPREQITARETQPRSLMPTGLLNGLTDSEIRDLVSYLRSPQPLQVN